MLLAALAVTTAAAGIAAAVASSHVGGNGHLPGNCDAGVVLFCADPAWPDAGGSAR